MAVNEIEFYFAPGCPWAWRTALWARNVAMQRSLKIHWKYFSLTTVNSSNPNYPANAKGFGLKSEKLMVAAGRHGGNDAVERIYMALGDLIHGQGKERTDALFTEALQMAGLPVELASQADSDASIEQELLRDHEKAVTELGAFGVPTIRIPGRDLGFFGPVVDPVPTGAEAVDLWDHFSWMLDKGYMFEIKRDRKYRPTASSLAMVNETIEPVPVLAGR